MPAQEAPTSPTRPPHNFNHSHGAPSADITIGVQRAGSTKAIAGAQLSRTNSGNSSAASSLVPPPDKNLNTSATEEIFQLDEDQNL
jgi:hypothetical protein